MTPQLQSDLRSSQDLLPLTAATLTRGPFLRAAALSGLAVGVLDATDGVAWFGLTAGQNPIQVLQYIASGALGASAYSGGLATAGLGALFHFALSIGFAVLFAIAYLGLSAVRQNWVVAGLGYGVAVWALMNLVVLPSSAIGPQPISAATAIHGVIGHALFVGLTAAYATRRLLGR